MSDTTINLGQTLNLCHAFTEVDGDYLGCNKIATHRVAGEMDSFGTEWLYFCDSDYKEFQQEMRKHNDEMRSGPCQWCKKQVTDRSLFQGMDADGPWDKQWVCGPCRQKDRDALNEELDYLDRVASRYSYSDSDDNDDNEEI